MHLAWTTPSSYTQSIEIDRKDGVGGTYAPLDTVGGGVTSYDDQTVTPGVQYFYIVKAIDLAGASPVSNELTVTPPMPTIVANSVFYNASTFDGMNGSSNQNDTISVATDKQALLPGQTATFQNVTSYSKGINGVIIDIADFYNLPRFEDYAFQVSADGTTWTAAPTPTIINLYPGRGPNGSTQITLIWDDNVIQNEWLQVTVLANDHTGLASDDVFYYGNLIGATGAGTTSTSVTVAAADVDSIVGDPHSPFNKAAITNVNDINRDRQVNANDAILARDNQGNTLGLITAPASGGGAAVPAALPPPALVPAAAVQFVSATAVSPAISEPASAIIDSASTVAVLAQPLSVRSLPSIAMTDGASTPLSGSPPVASQPRPRSILESHTIAAACVTGADTNRATASWGSGQPVGTGDGGSNSLAAAALDEVFASLSTGRRRRRG